MSSISLVTPSDRRNVELCALQCESVDRHVSCYVTHYLILPDDDFPLFDRFNGARRVVVPASQLLPAWLWPLPGALWRNGWQYWWSLRASPIGDPHVRRILKLSAANTFPEDRHCILGPDVVFFRRFDLSMLLRPRLAPLFNAPGAIPDSPAHSPAQAQRVRTSHRLLGLDAPSFPATDFVSRIAVWDRQAVRALVERIEAVTGTEWVEALCRARTMSEYMLYGCFVQNSPRHLADHALTAKRHCLSWCANGLDRASVEAALRTAGEDYVAFSAARFAGTSVDILRATLIGLPEGQQQVA
jgi:hypothetical protein